MDICVMFVPHTHAHRQILTHKCASAPYRSHPGPGKPNGALLSPWLALQNIEVEFFGHRYVHPMLRYS